MTEPVWLLRSAVELFHEETLRQHGGASGIRDEGMLESALARPKNKFLYEEPSLPMLAAAYAFGISRNHPFIDGNKRTALVSCVTFLRLNGLNLQATEVDVYKTMIALAAGELDEDELAAWIEAHSAQL